MKPQLTILQKHQIIYQWGFPFSIRFTYQGSKFICRSPEELKHALQDLRLVESTLKPSSSNRRTTSSDYQNLSQHTGKTINQQAHRRSHHSSPPLEEEDVMD